MIGFGVLVALVGELGRQGRNTPGSSEPTSLAPAKVPARQNDRLGSDLGPKAPSRHLGDGWGIENADAFLECASQRTRWTHSDLRDTWIILEPNLRRTNMTPHEAQAFVVMLAFAATASDLSIQEARQGMRKTLEQAKGHISKKTKSELEAKYLAYCR
jgi:hypothetical protein